MINKKLINTGAASPAPFDPLQNFETVTYTGNGGTQKITGYIRKGAAFNGSSSFIETPSLIPTNDFTFSCWVYFDSLAPSSNYSMIYNAYKNTFWYLALYDGGKIATYNGTTSLNTTSNVISAGQWHHIVYTSSSTNGKNIYLDGNTTPVATVADNTGNSNPSGSWEGFGKYYASPFYYLQGKIDQVRIFNKAVSVSEVTTLYGETFTSATKSTTDIFGDSSGVALYELDENANDTGKGAIDSGQSGVFNGSSSGISIPSVNLGTSFTISVWFNWDGQDNNQNATIVGSNDENPSIIHNKFSTSNSISYDYSGGSVMLLSSVTANQWYHIVIVHNGTSFEGFVNGVSGGTNTVSNITATIEGIGYDSNQSRFLSGKIDQVRFYSSALSGSDITKLFNESSVPTANLVAWYKLDGDATDETTNYDGTWTGTEAYTDPATFPVYNGTATNVNFLGMAFQPDFVWIKCRTDVRSHSLLDTVRGASKIIQSENTTAEWDGSLYFDSFDSNGFTVKSSANFINNSSHNYVAWCWKAGSQSLNDDGTIQTTIRANPDAGFSIVKFSNNNSATNTFGHGLGGQPELVFIKGINFSVNWFVYVNSLGKDKRLILNSHDAASNWSSNDGTNTSIGINDTVLTYPYSGTTYNFIAYCFRSISGYQKIGSYTGNTSSYPRVYTTDDGTSTGANGFMPRFLLIKNHSSAYNWAIYDDAREPVTSEGESREKQLYPNTLQIENGNLYGDPVGRIDFYNDGFQLQAALGNINQNNGSFIYLAIA